MPVDVQGRWFRRLLVAGAVGGIALAVILLAARATGGSSSPWERELAAALEEDAAKPRASGAFGGITIYHDGHGPGYPCPVAVGTAVDYSQSVGTALSIDPSYLPPDVIEQGHGMAAVCGSTAIAAERRWLSRKRGGPGIDIRRSLLPEAWVTADAPADRISLAWVAGPATAIRHVFRVGDRVVGNSGVFWAEERPDGMYLVTALYGDNITLDQLKSVANSLVHLDVEYPGISPRTPIAGAAKAGLFADGVTRFPKVDTTGWKTYSNATYGYSFMYPPSWQIQDRDNQGHVSPYTGEPAYPLQAVNVTNPRSEQGGEGAPGIGPPPKALGFYVSIEKAGCGVPGDLIVVDKVKVDGIEGDRCVVAQPGQRALRIVFIEFPLKDGINFIVIGLQRGLEITPAEQAVLEKVFSTFRFIRRPPAIANALAVTPAPPPAAPPPRPAAAPSFDWVAK